MKNVITSTHAFTQGELSAQGINMPEGFQLIRSEFGGFYFDLPENVTLPPVAESLVSIDYDSLSEAAAAAESVTSMLSKLGSPTDRASTHVFTQQELEDRDIQVPEGIKLVRSEEGGFYFELSESYQGLSGPEESVLTIDHETLEQAARAARLAILGK